ncbi:MAG TPA: serine hydrolase [Chryseosolibacter sp.]|nr:serine hydrolase [Chryseosolibacter sp.]
MRRSPPLYVAVVLVFALMVSGCHRQTPPLVSSIDVAKSLDDLVTQLLIAYPIPGLAVVVVKGDSVYWETKGNAGLEKVAPLTDSTLFFAGSLSEPIVATAILRLVELGRVKLDDPVVLHLSYFRMGSQDYHNVTIRHLLTHTSGVPRHNATWDFPNDAEDALASTTRSIAEEPPVNHPGAQVARSAYNFDIAADLIRNASTMPFEDFVEKHVLRPLRMDKSSFRLRDGQVARPHEVDDWLRRSFRQRDLYPYNPEHSGSLGFHTCAQDVGKWMHAVLHQPEHFLKRDLWKELVAMQYKTSHNSGVGLGWEIESTSELLALNKSYHVGGFAGNIRMVPEDKTAVFVTSNIGSDFNPALVTQHIFSLLADPRPPEIKIPVHLILGNKLADTGNIDSVFALYQRIKRSRSNLYDCSLAALSELGVTLLYRVKDIERATKFFAFCTKEFKGNAEARLNLAEAYLVGGRIREASLLLDSVRTNRLDPHLVPRLKHMEGLLAEKATEYQSQTKP